MKAVFELLCLFMFAVGLMLVLLYWRTRYDRAFLFSGVTIVCLAAVAGVDIWVDPRQCSANDMLYWMRIQHVFACATFCFLAWYVSLLSKRFVLEILRVLVAFSVVVGLLSMSDWCMMVKEDRLVTTLLYSGLWGAYLLLVAVYVLRNILHTAFKGNSTDQRIAYFHLFGFAMLFVCGVTDLAFMTVAGPGNFVIPNFTMIGVLLLGIMISLVFAERFLQLVQDRARAYDRLHAVVQEMEAAAGVRQLGEVSAMVGHELRNDLQVIHGAMELLSMREAISPRGQKTLAMMRERVMKALQFSQDMLDLVRSRMLREKTALDLRAVIHHTIESCYPARAQDFVWEAENDVPTVLGDWGKLEHVFGNLFKNSFEANARTIRIRFSRGPGVLVVALEDDGKGCDDPAVVRKFFTAFNTTKNEKFGTGLGMAVTRAIVEAHGGYISAYSKNLTRRGDHGLCVEITLPVSEAVPVFGEVALVKGGVTDIEPVLRVLRNVHVAPRICEKPVELLESGPRTRLVLIGADRSRELGALGSRVDGEILLLAMDNALVYAMPLAGDAPPQLFTEEYVVRCLKRESQLGG